MRLALVFKDSRCLVQEFDVVTADILTHCSQVDGEVEVTGPIMSDQPGDKYFEGLNKFLRLYISSLSVSVF